MDMDTSRTLTKVLGKRDIDKIPSDVLKKLEKYCETNNEQLVQIKVLYNTTQKNIEKLRKEYEKLLSTTQDTTAKKDAAQVNVTELRHQLDAANAEVARLTRQVTNEESESASYRSERNRLIDEKDQLIKTSDSKDITINRLQLDLKSLENELKSAISEKGDAIARFAEMAAKEQSLDDREKRMEKEIERLNNDIEQLTSRYDEASSELDALKSGNSTTAAQLENDLKRMTEELRVANSNVSQLNEANEILKKQCDGESVKLKEQLSESNALTEHYKRELDAKIKLCDLYKSSFDEGQSRICEINTEASKLQKVLKETTAKCVDLETKLKCLQDQHQEDVKSKDVLIEQLEKKVEEASAQLKTVEADSLEKLLEKMFPKAAACKKLLKDDVSLTEMYGLYYKALADIHRLEVDCMHSNAEVERLTIKLRNTTDEIEKQKVDHKNCLKLNEEITQQLDSVAVEQNNLRDKLNETANKLAIAEKENHQMKCTQKDLSRQICNLLNKKETIGESADQQQFKRMGLSNDTIRKELVTFDNIVELQENNQKLMVKVRELNGKIEKLEEQNVGMKSHEEKISALEKRFLCEQQTRQADEHLLAMTLKQKDRFKQLYFDAMKYMGQEALPVDSDGNAAMSIGKISTNETIDGKDQKLLEMEQTLQQKVKELKVLKEEHNEYRKEATINFDILKEEYDAMERRLIDLQSTKSQLQSQTQFEREKIKSYENDVAIYKKQIQILEERNAMYDKTIAKHETSYKNLADDARNTISQLTTAKNRCEHLEMECRRLIKSNKSLDIENKALHRQKMTESILQCNLEILKISSERSDFEGRVQLEKQLDDQVSQCTALTRKLEEEENRFRVENESLKRQKDNALMKMADEQKQCEVLQTKLSEAREQVKMKTQQIKNLSEKLQEALTPCKSDNPIAKGNKKIKDLELQVKSKVAEIEKLKSELEASATKVQSLSMQKLEWENESKALKENYEAWKVTLNAELQASRLKEANLKSQVDELQQEIRLQLSSSNLKDSNVATQSKIQAEYEEALRKISENNKELRELRLQCHNLKTNLEAVEKKYASEILKHAADVEILTSRTAELTKYHDQIHQIKLAKDEADEILKATQSEWEATSKKMIERREELEQKVESLEKQVSEFVQLLQQKNDLTTNDESLNESIGNRSFTDDEFKDYSAETVFNVAKYLKREKDIAVAKIESVNVENTRLSAELNMMSKRIDELTSQLTSTKSTASESADIISTAKYEDLQRNMQTLKVVTDTNMRMRTEKQLLENKVKELNEKVEKIEAQLQPLREQNRELNEKNRETEKENNMLRSNVEKFRVKVSELSERATKNPEDFTRLQNERENLAKMLTSEKDNQRQINEELNSLKAEKARLEQEVAGKSKHLQTATDDRKKLQDELNNFKQINIRLTLESIEMKDNILKKEEDVKAIQRELATIEEQLRDSRNKEMQIRRIAKKYKDSFFELKTKDDERENTKTSEDSSAGTSTESKQELIDKLTSLQEEINELKKENEDLKKQDENQMLAEARNRVLALTETNKQISRDYQACKSQLQTCEQSRSEHDAAIAALKSQLEAKIKELLDQEVSRHETIARLTRENENLNTRVNQLHRQLQQQGSKPSTSSATMEKSPSDPARTANVKPMATPSAQQSTTVNLRRGGDTPLASIRPMSVQNSRTAAVLPTSQTSNVVAVQGTSTGSVTTALVPPQQQVHTTGNTSTAEAMSSSPTSSHTDYMPATSSAVVAAVPPMGSTSAESTQEAESLSVNTNESSSSSTSSQAVLQQQTVALVSPRVEVAAQVVPSQQVVDQNQAASTSGSSSSFVTAMSSHHQASSSNTVTTTQAGHKRPRDTEGDSSTGVEESSASEKTSPQNKRTRLLGEQTFQGVTESGLDVEYQVPTSSQRDQEDDVVAVDSEEDDEDAMDIEAVAVEVDDNFDGDNGDTDEIESLGQDEGEGHDIDEDNARNDNNEVDVDDSSNTPNQSTSGTAARVNPGEVNESPTAQETQQIQTISSGSDAGPSSQANVRRQAQTPTSRQQPNVVSQQTYEEGTDDSIVPSTPTLYVARRADGDSVSSPHPTVPHATRFAFNNSSESTTSRPVVATPTVEASNDTIEDLSDPPGGQSSSSSQQDSQQIGSVDSNVKSKPDEQVAGTSRVADENKLKTDDGASTTISENAADRVSSEAEKAPVAVRNTVVQVEEDREAEASVLPRNTRSRRVYQRGRGMPIENQRPNPVMWHQPDNYGRYHQMPHHQQQHPHQHRGSPTRGPLARGGRGRPRRPYR
ncbi:Nucleoprotein TPR [Pseudolycoriella hygida]|uniref:Nucleoprotein TPR n=1 Tax=Pseudolycoriella hygida TaxID=35572 RepID=A0A9Q0N9I7_9DIPT|nr:Nucleoprotein TPR [Pseudolycoriella hygida]